jgi:hypothetical protein
MWGRGEVRAGVGGRGVGGGHIWQLVEGLFWLFAWSWDGGEDPGSAIGPECGTWAVGHGRRRVTVRDLPIAGRPVVL